MVGQWGILMELWKTDETGSDRGEKMKNCAGTWWHCDWGVEQCDRNVSHCNETWDHCDGSMEHFFGQWGIVRAGCDIMMKLSGILMEQ